MATITLSIECDHSIHKQLKEDLQQLVKEEIIIVERQNLDGTSAVLEIMKVIISLAGTITPIVALYLDNKEKNKIKKIKFDNIEIENPTTEQWEKIWNEYLSKTSDKK